MRSARFGVTCSSPSSPVIFRSGAHALDDDHDDAPHDERRSDRDGTEEVRFDRLPKEEPHDRRGEKPEDQRDQQRLRLWAPLEEPRSARAEERAVLDDDREHGAELDYDLERIEPRPLRPESLARENEVTGGRDREVLGEPLHDPKDNGDERRHRQARYHETSGSRRIGRASALSSKVTTGTDPPGGI